MRRIAIMGSTGSIGVQALDVIRNLNENGEEIEVFALSAHENIELLARQANEWKPRVIVLGNAALKDKLASLTDNSVKIFGGAAGLVEVAEMEGYDLFLNAMLGCAGLAPTFSAIKAKKRILLANKETLVAGGGVVMKSVRENGVDILPIDSEHSAIFQCLRAGEKKEAEKIILTASGGPFRGKTKAELSRVTLKDALAHPTWRMGKKITVDSATLMNKGLELIEAKWLFDMKAEKIEVAVHPESVVHSAVCFRDGSMIAHLGAADMRVPIQYAITHPKRQNANFNAFSLFDRKLTFEKPDLENFPCLGLAIEAVKKGGLYPCVMNAANEIAVNAFLNGKIPYLSIYVIIEKTVASYTHNTEPSSLEAVLEADTWARACALHFIKELSF